MLPFEVGMGGVVYLLCLGGGLEFLGGPHWLFFPEASAALIFFLFFEDARPMYVLCCQLLSVRCLFLTQLFEWVRGLSSHWWHLFLSLF